MDTDKSDLIIRRILGKLNMEVVPKVKQNSRKAEEFKDKVWDAIPKGGPGGYRFHFIHCGSAFEGLAVKEETDFDITMILGDPFESYNFTTRRDPSGFFTLEWKSHLPNKFFNDCDNFLDAAKLRRDLFGIVSRAVESLNIPNADIKYREQLVALTVEIRYSTGETVSIDFVPQIVFRTWGQCPDLRPLSELPKCLRAYIDTSNRNKSPIMSFSMAVPDSQQYPNPDQLFSVSFGLLEKNFLISEVKLRDMVRMVKLKALQQNWKRLYKFQSFFAKRIAVKHCDELKDKSLCEGYRAILGYLLQDVKNGYMDDYFIKNLVAYRWEPKRAFEFQEAIARAMNEDPSDILKQM
ncbi:uncharacterized protein LOC135205513 [Macrobrachium nipponense]|uniref:uncharacterized protein LOC135205513 n=1 Tax=Macrobrachium nipponense TaxID=159736 RepID=UPI0030C7B28B